MTSVAVPRFDPDGTGREDAVLIARLTGDPAIGAEDILIA